MGSGSSHCRQCQQDIDSYGNVQVEHQLFCNLWYEAANRIWIEPDMDGIYELERTIEDQNRTINNLRSQIASKWKLKQEIKSLKEQNEDFKKANKDLARKNKSLQITIENERKVMQISHQDLRKQAAGLKNNLELQIYAYEDELDQANGKMTLYAEKIQNQRIQLQNLNKKQEQFTLRLVLK